MNPEQENFESLRRLLALKRSEQPPPGYFDNFSTEVIARIRLGERAKKGSLFEQLSDEAPWFQRLWAMFETRPAFAGALGILLFGALAGGVFYSNMPDKAPVALVAPTPDAATGFAGSRTLQLGGPLASRTVGVRPEQPVSAAASLFDNIKLPPAQTVNFVVPSGN